MVEGVVHFSFGSNTVMIPMHLDKLACEGLALDLEAKQQAVL